MTHTWPLHGTAASYRKGCRCYFCCDAGKEYRRARRIRRRLTVPGTKARRHILALAKHGIGTDSISAACDVGTDTVHRIRTGQKRIYARTERKILSVTPEAVSDGCRVDATFTRNLLQELLDEGYTIRQLSLLLGKKDGTLSMMHRRKVTAKMQLRVEKLYRKAMNEGFGRMA